ncbi:hypothetical protein FB384_004940 [Prauserella sediminis]|uniref:Uncharacterized protein n=1 Tax=Prauserella sediminis TaxID=577680 RepID=A0A839XTF1_9PSEU|nr:hypothetical protein [Prauserella sediminis]
MLSGWTKCPFSSCHSAGSRALSDTIRAISDGGCLGKGKAPRHHPGGLKAFARPFPHQSHEKVNTCQWELS